MYQTGKLRARRKVDRLKTDKTRSLKTSGQDGGAGDEDLADIEVMFWTLNTIPSDLETVEDAINAITEEKINTTVHLNIIEMGSYRHSSLI